MAATKLYCSPGIANCCMILSVWGILQLLFLGYLFGKDSIGLYHDYDAGKGQDIATNCFITASLYFGALLLSVYSIYMNNKDAEEAERAAAKQ